MPKLVAFMGDGVDTVGDLESDVGSEVIVMGDTAACVGAAVFDVGNGIRTVGDAVYISEVGSMVLIGGVGGS